MKVKEWFKTLLAGVGIGVGSAIPGVSGGTIAVILKVYDKLLWAVSHIFKEFKKAVIYLLPILLGVVIALIPSIYLLDKALDGFVFAIVCLFTGFIIGSFPGVVDEVKGEKIKPSYIITLVITLIIALMLGIGSVLLKADATNLFINPSWWVYLVLIPIGVVASCALVVPGVSGSMVLLIIGVYDPLISSTVQTVIDCCFNGNFSNLGIQFGLLACFAIGVIVGFYFISKLMHYLLDKYHHITFYGIIGFIIGSTIALFYNYKIYSYYQVWMNGSYIKIPMEIEIPVGIVLLVVALVGSYLLVRYKRKIDKESASN